MKSQTKKRSLTGLLFGALVIWSAIGFSPVGHFGLPLMVWLMVEALLLGPAIVIVSASIADWADRDD